MHAHLLNKILISGLLIALGVMGTSLTLKSGIAAEKSNLVQLGPRPFFLVGKMKESALKDRLSACEAGPFYKTDFSIAHRGAPMQFPEHTKESYEAAAKMGAGIIECDATFTKDKELVCRHSQCDLHTTTDILLRPDLSSQCSQSFSPASNGAKASAKCCTSDITLAQFQTLKGKMDSKDPQAKTVEEYVKGGAAWRTELYSNEATLMTHAQSIDLIDSLGRKFVPELKTPSSDEPFNSLFTRESYAQKLVDEYKERGIDPKRVFLQSFDLKDILYWIKNEPEFGEQAVYLDGRYRQIKPNDPASFNPSMKELATKGVKIIAPPIWMLLALDSSGAIVASTYAKEAKKAGLKIITWSLERSGPLANGGGWYYKTVSNAIQRDGDMMTVLDVLAEDVGVIGVFSDWPATTTFYASCTNRN
ncbi:MAG: glycerophosphodiester phosphodiesterase family protein [Sneathiella sp.]